MVLIPFLVFVLVPDFHSGPKRLRMTRTRGTELKPFLTILGTRMRASQKLLANAESEKGAEK
jgi:hypothetical protein